MGLPFHRSVVTIRVIKIANPRNQKREAKISRSFRRSRKVAFHDAASKREWTLTVAERWRDGLSNSETEPETNLRFLSRERFTREHFATRMANRPAATFPVTTRSRNFEPGDSAVRGNEARGSMRLSQSRRTIFHPARPRRTKARATVFVPVPV